MRHQFQSSDSRGWWGDWEVRSDRSSSLLWLRLSRGCEKLWLGTSPEWQLPPVWNIQDYPVQKKPVLGSNFFSIPSSQFSFLKNLFDLKIIWLISQVLPLFWILDPSLELGIKTKENTSISISSLIQPGWWCSLFSGVICIVLLVCPGSGCDARLVRAGADFVHI